MLISLRVTAAAKESGQFCVKVLDSFIKNKTKQNKKPKHLIPDIIKTKKKTMDYFLKVYFGIENTKNVINMTFLLSILCHYVKMLYRILCKIQLCFLGNSGRYFSGRIMCASQTF